VAERCIAHLGAGGKPADIGVLYRANAQAKAIELALREARLPYRTYGGQSFFERKEVKDFVSYLRLVLDPEDRLALWRVINTPNRGIGLKTLERIDETAKARRISPHAVITGDALPGGAAVRQFAEMMGTLRAAPTETAADLEALGLRILKETGLENDVRVKTEDAGARERKLANLRSLPQWLASLGAEIIAAEERLDLQTLLDSLSLDNDRREEKDGARNHISLMTVHAAKGLEFPAVFVVGLEEELLPHKNSIPDPQALCEERRLFYVALTRAKQKLHLSYAIERAIGPSRVARTPSRFLKELPEATYVSSDDAASAAKRAQSEAERRAATASRLGALRASLGQARR
jgi:superfamily I DNA/RNA helicase